MKYIAIFLYREVQKPSAEYFCCSFRRKSLLGGANGRKLSTFFPGIYGYGLMITRNWCRQVSGHPSERHISWHSCCIHHHLDSKCPLEDPFQLLTDIIRLKNPIVFPKFADSILLSWRIKWGETLCLWLIHLTYCLTEEFWCSHGRSKDLPFVSSVSVWLSQASWRKHGSLAKSSAAVSCSQCWLVGSGWVVQSLVQ